jgi:hypothetical protein
MVAAGITRFAGRFARATVFALVAVFGLSAAVAGLQFDRTQAGEIAAAVRTGGSTSDLVVYCPDQLGPAVHRLLPSGLEQLAYPDLSSPELVDWVDYEQRHDAASPAAVAEEVMERAGSRTIWVVASPDYEGVEGHCETFLAELGARRPGTAVVAEDGDRFYEHASLTVFREGD